MARSRSLVALLAALPVLGVLAAVPAAGAAPTSVRTCTARPAAGHFTCFALRRTDVRQPAVAATPSGYGPSDLAAAYDLPSGGSGQTVYVVDAYDDPSAESDLAVYRAQYGLPACTTADGCFRKLNQRGAAGSYPAANAGWAGEISLDLDVVSATCPDCAITLVEADDDGDNLFDAVDTAVGLGARFVSMSWGADETGYERSYDATFAHPGVVFTAATGDYGWADGANYPATSPDVVAVGGTTLTTSTSTRGWAERAWGDAGSGCSGDEAKPTYQAAAVSASTCARRASADVSAVANPNTGVAVYETYGGKGWGVYGGTSASAPLVASVYALAGTPADTAPQRSLYTHAAALNDVTSGSTGSCGGSALCTAGTGWDGPTGLGTPDGLAAFTGAAPGAGAFRAVTPARLLDTRTGTGVGTGAGTKGAVAAGRTVTLHVTGTAGVPADGVGAVVLDLVSTGSTAGGYVTAWPAGAAQPTTSNLDHGAGQTAGDLAIVPVGTDGDVMLYTSATSQLVADVSGYYLAGDPVAAGAFGPLTPDRLLDTRTAGGPVAAGHLVKLKVAGAGGVPAGGAGAVALTVTSTGSSANGYVTVYANTAATRPGTSNLNFRAGHTVANLVIAPVGSDGVVDLYTNVRTNLVVDVSGWFAAGSPTAAGTYGALTPARLLDTRTGSPLAAGGTRVVTVVGSHGVPSAVTAVVLNVTATNEAANGYVTAFAHGTARPGTSSLNFVAGVTVPNLVVVPVGSDGRVSLYANRSTDVVVDVLGYTTF